ECHIGKPHWHAQLTAELRGKPHVLVSELQGEARRVLPCLYLVDTFPEGEPLLEWCANYGLEGIVSKRRTSGYASGPRRHWVKTKCANWKRENAERHRLFEQFSEPKITERDRALAKKREELARVLERLEAPDVSLGIAKELRRHQALLETEI